jgi:hypothetical protein
VPTEWTMSNDTHISPPSYKLPGQVESGSNSKIRLGHPVGWPTEQIEFFGNITNYAKALGVRKNKT